MPCKSEKQKRLMEGVAHSPSFAAKVGIPQSVGKEFVGVDSIPSYHLAVLRGDADLMAYHSDKILTRGEHGSN